MPWRNTRDRFGGLARLFHWLTVLMLVGSFSLGLSMVGLEFSPQKLQLYSWHKWLGVTIFAVTVARLGWRLASPPPPLPDGMPGVQKRLAHASHFMLYLVLVVMPLTGWTMSSALGTPVVYLGLVQLPDLVAANRGLADTLELIHGTLAWVLLALIAVHVLAALYHHVVLKDDVLRRMLPWRRGAAAEGAERAV